MDFLLKHIDKNIGIPKISTNLVTNSVERLYFRILIIGLITSTSSIFVQFFNTNISELYSSITFFVIISLSLLFYIYDYKKLSFHTNILSLTTLNTFMFVVMESDYKAILLFFPAAMLACFILFQQRKVLFFYLFYFIFLQILIIYKALLPLQGFNSQFIAENINVIVLNLIVFLSCYYYFNTLQKAKKALENATVDMMKQQQILRDKNKQLEAYIESNLQLESYTHLASHELKAPLQTLKGFSDILQRKLDHKLDDKEKQLMGFISGNSNKMMTLLNDLADLGSVSQTTLEIETVSLNDLFEDILRDRNHAIQERQAQVDYQTNGFSIQGQTSLLLQLFSNLVGNAIKFVDKEQQPRVKISTRLKGDLVEIAISDNGIGIAPENRDKIFQIFTRLHTEATFKGSGIGLAICKKIVDLHKGTIAVRESEWRGACFVVRLPVSQEK